MKLLLLILILFLNTQIAFSQIIEWNESYKLDWKDFKGPTKDRPVAASTYCGITLKPDKRNIWNGKSTYKVIADFSCDSSYYFPDRVNYDVLKHEQLHFDIAELYARKIRKAFAEKPFKTPEEAKVIYGSLYKEYFNFQTNLEVETEFGTKKEEQLRWEKLVNDKLLELIEYK